ncbi:hypothetical protein M8J76_001377 [Diaphorina citri]|nr:hypothetical protein M8J75_008261 [Diaphorina citri]KAI5723103.1 hypothetical protein M8J76_001377 [Diaphorina citri]KAI5728279.1 hypothetical protein M8J77_014107 [Diaphorina citri]
MLYLCILDTFVTSHEFTLARDVPDLRLGIVGSLASGKSALVHRFMTGAFLQEESPEGGRFKKEVVIDGHSHLLLIRDEGVPPELQFTLWIDAVIFVFSLENEASFNAIYNYYTKMSHYRNAAEIPIILVGTQDAISESNPRIIDEARARRLASDLKRCSYYETCATYGLNVDRVFQDACHRIVQARISGGPPGTPRIPPSPSLSLTSPLTMAQSPGPGSPGSNHSYHKDSSSTLSRHISSLSSSSHQLYRNHTHPELSENNNTLSIPSPSPTTKDGLPTPSSTPTTSSSTPTTSRKTRRRSNLFTPSSKKNEEKLRNGELGSGRAIPLKQGYLYKKSSKGLNKEWKKKYVTLCDDGKMTYHPSLHDYMEDVHGKEIPLQYVTVKIPGLKPKGCKSVPSTNGINEALTNISISSFQSKDKRCADKVMLTSFELLKDNHPSLPSIPSSNEDLLILPPPPHETTPTVKKRHRRLKSSGVKNQDCDDSDSFELLIVSLDNKQWQFEAANSEERDDWIAAIQQQILSSLQGNEILNKGNGKSRLQSSVETASLQSIRSRVPGNLTCADCAEAGPTWASLNLGLLLCIQCCGVHRCLGAHVSRVRSLELDEWPPGHLSVMLSIGNTLANSVWESNLTASGVSKPCPTSSREEKERYIRVKYEAKQFLAPVPSGQTIPQLIIDAICRCDMQQLVLALCHSTPDDVNSTVSPRDLRTPLHLACAMGSLPITQLLLWYGGNPRTLDHEGKSCLSYARLAASRPPSTDPPRSPLGIEAQSGGAGALVDLLMASGCHDNVLSKSCLDKMSSSII